MHNVLELPHSQTQYDNGPTQLIQLKFDMTRLHGRNRQYKRASIKTKREHGRQLRILQQIMQFGIRLDPIDHEFGVTIKNSNKEPHPLRGSKQRNGLINPIEERIVANGDEFAKE